VTDLQAEALWAAEIERRAREVADGRVALIDSDEVHAEIAQTSFRPAVDAAGPRQYSGRKRPGCVVS